MKRRSSKSPNTPGRSMSIEMQAAWKAFMRSEGDGQGFGNPEWIFKSAFWYGAKAAGKQIFAKLKRNKEYGGF